MSEVRWARMAGARKPAQENESVESRWHFNAQRRFNGRGVKRYSSAPSFVFRLGVLFTDAVFAGVNSVAQRVACEIYVGYVGRRNLYVSATALSHVAGRY